MKGNASMKLWEACFDKTLFRQMLEEIVSNTSNKHLFDVLAYCYERYSDMHPDVLLDVFSGYRQKAFSNDVLKI